MNRLRLVVGSLWLATALAVEAESGSDARRAIDEAKAAYAKADSVQGAWINTPRLIEKAEAAVAQGDETKALELARAAKEEAELGYTQAVHEKEHWAPPSYLR
jgi:Rad3-related DNA helicase